ncbi:unnamed protein product [Meloidogyne enterolobii]|uniref:Uncharacterized protein n=1 Tax=Meloidogyne enterolobii TaxID=390850 RepID=A0ACB0Z5Q7_MELEN
MCAYLIKYFYMFTLHSRTTFAHFPAVTNTPDSLLYFSPHTCCLILSFLFGCASPSAFLFFLTL